jgi:hypothetical protein
MSTTTAIKERPILFSGPMVCAILDGSKTQTRRVVKMPPDFEQFTHLRSAQGAEAPKNTFIAYWLEYGKEESGGTFFRCPFGKPGERLWVRETWAAPHGFDAWSPRDIPKGARIYYSATADLKGPFGVGGLRCRPSIFMPRWASRITLEIADVRVERLQSISDDDARAEGYDGSHAFPREWFARLWERINGLGSWKANPWVWVVEFRRVQP